MTDELRGKIMKVFVGLRAKSYNYLTDNSRDEKAKGTKSVSIKANFNLKIIKSVINHFEENKIDIDSL